MEIPKEQILQPLRDRGDHEKADQADPGELLGDLGEKLGL
jgi:hypothetical protein